MDIDTRLVGMACAGIAVASTVLYYALKFKELRVLREIRDSLSKGTKTGR